MCGASSSQESLEASQQAFYSQLTSQYNTLFGESQAITGALTKSFQPILAAGINQEGFSPDELANLNSQAVTGTGENYAKVKAALGAEQGAEGGGTSYIPSGAKMQQQDALATSAASNESGIESNILADDYSTGRSNYLAAAGGLGNVASELNPEGEANAATGAGSAAGTTANQIQQANSQWMQLAAAGLGAAGSIEEGKCWIAKAVYGSWNSDRVFIARHYIFTMWPTQSLTGRIVSKLYGYFGRPVGKLVEKSALLRSAFKPLFDAANRRFWNYQS